MSEIRRLEVMGPVITEAMRAARNDEVAERIDESVGKMHCAFPGCPFAPWPHQTRTLYQEESSNWHLLCEAHAAETDDYWDERWAEYHRDCM